MKDWDGIESDSAEGGEGSPLQPLLLEVYDLFIWLLTFASIRFVNFFKTYDLFAS